MAADLSTTFQEAISSTVEAALSSGGSASVESIYKTSERFLKGLNVLVVNGTFAFEKLTTTVKFILPAQTATKIAHSMLMEDTPPLDTINEDIADAMKESITQICGTLQTVINGMEDLEELGKVSFSIGGFEIIDGGTYTLTNALILLKLSIEENIFDYLIDFEENFLPYIEEFNNASILSVEENDDLDEQAPPSNEEAKEEPSQNDDDDYTPSNEEGETVSSQENNSEENESSQTVNNDETPPIKEDENSVDGAESSLSEEEEALAKKNKKIKMLVMILGGLIALILITFFTLLFMGYFDKEEIVVDTNKTKDLNQTKISEESLVIAEIKNKQIDFKLDMIDIDRVNNKLQYLTKYEILEEDVLAKYKKAEAERLYKIKMEKLEEFALNNKEESLYKSNIDDNNSESAKLKDRFSDEGDTSTQVINDEENAKAMANESLVFIKVDPKEYKKYKEVITENKQNSTQISICKDNNGIVNVYVGPLYLKTVINNIMNGSKKVDNNSTKDMAIVSIIRSDFNKMCDF